MKPHETEELGEMDHIHDTVNFLRNVRAENNGDFARDYGYLKNSVYYPLKTHFSALTFKFSSMKSRTANDK